MHKKYLHLEIKINERHALNRGTGNRSRSADRQNMCRHKKKELIIKINEKHTVSSSHLFTGVLTKKKLSKINTYVQKDDRERNSRLKKEGQHGGFFLPLPFSFFFSIFVYALFESLLDQPTNQSTSQSIKSIKSISQLTNEQNVTERNRT